MRRCDECGVSFTGDFDECPLCQAPLRGEAEPAVFPRNEVKASGATALRVLAFATGAAVLTVLFLGHAAFNLPRTVILAICVALLTNYALVRHVMSSAPDVLRWVARYFLVLIALTLLWYVLVRNPLITTYVVPSLCIVALVSDAVLMAVFRGRFVSGYAKYLLFNMALGLMPLALTALGLTTWSVPSLASALVACVLLLGLLVFARERLASEVRKLFTA